MGRDYGESGAVVDRCPLGRGRRDSVHVEHDAVSAERGGGSLGLCGREREGVRRRIAAAATAASTELPPWFRMASADCEACSLMVATAPPVPVETGVLASASGAMRMMERVRVQVRAVADRVM